jgi:hypothetical protein
MKKIIFLFLLTFFATRCFAQDSINPYNIQQACNIVLHDSNVYYCPFAPPGAMDTRANLSTECNFLNDPNGVGGPGWDYQIKVYDYSSHSYVNLRDWHPCGTPLGHTAVWQRLFTAKRDSAGQPHDIIAGGGAPGSRVTISANEDVDFRASGRVILKSGFHVKPGAFFHAYTEPKWDTAVFSDEFDSAAKFYNQWHITTTWGSNYYTPGAECAYDSNVRLVTDPDAHDGHAVDLLIREDTVNFCHCDVYGNAPNQLPDSSCGNPADTTHYTPRKYIFSAGTIRSCPFPFLSKADSAGFATVYAHAPYGKYEYREKIPHIKHHTNNWGGDFQYGFEYDLNETEWVDSMGLINPDWNHSFRRGPYKGRFGRLGGTSVFISSEPDWCPSNSPNAIVINNIPYDVDTVSGHGTNMVELASYSYYMGWPSSLASDTTDTVTFYYAINTGSTADKLPWRVAPIAGKWRKFYAGYHVIPGLVPDTLRFSKINQPVKITLTTQTIPSTVQKTFNCHWESTLNTPIDSGILLLDFPSSDADSVATMAWSDLHNGNEPYSFIATDLYSDAGYPVPPVAFNGIDTVAHYEYHTFAMEWLPHEVRFLVDSVVVRRMPDRLIPPGTPYSDWVTTMPRGLTDLRPSQIDFDNNVSDSLGLDTSHNMYGGWNSQMYMERQYFEHAAAVELASPTPGWPGFEMVDGKPVAHHMIDYVKVWDVPKDVKIPNYPN